MLLFSRTYPRLLLVVAVVADETSIKTVQKLTCFLLFFYIFIKKTGQETTTGPTKENPTRRRHL